MNCQSKNTLAIVLLLFVFARHEVNAQACQSSKDLEAIPGKQIDAANCEWPQQRAHWFDALGTPANKTVANTVLTKIETLEKQSRSNFVFTGGVLKSGFSSKEAAYTSSQFLLATYDLNIGCHEYICVKNALKVNGEYDIVFRAYVNRFKDLQYAFNTLHEQVFYATPYKFDSKYIKLHDFIRIPDKTMYEAIAGNGTSFYQDVPDDKVKPGNRSIYITRHWYITKPGVPLLEPVSRKEYLEALLEYFDREKLQTSNAIREIEKTYATRVKNAAGNQQRLDDAKRSYTIDLARYPNWQQRIATKVELVNKALKENTSEWLSKPTVVKSKQENFSWQNSYGPGSNEYVRIDGYNADTKEDAQKTGAFTFSGFWDDKGGDVLYRYNPEYFKTNSSTIAPRMIELAYRYVKTPLGQNLVDNFTNNFDFDAVRKMLE